MTTYEFTTKLAARFFFQKWHEGIYTSTAVRGDTLKDTRFVIVLPPCDTRGSTESCLLSSYSTPSNLRLPSVSYVLSQGEAKEFNFDSLLSYLDAQTRIQNLIFDPPF